MIDSLEELKEAYKKAKEGKITCFMFQGKEILTDYAKYLIQYLEMNKEIQQRINLN